MKGSYRLTAAQKHQAALRYGRGDLTTDIARDLGCTPPNVVQLARRRGITPDRKWKGRDESFREWLEGFR